MSLIDLPTAKLHLRLEADYPDEQVEPYLLAAEDAATQFLNRAVFADEDARTSAIAAVPAQLATALAAYNASYTDATALQPTDPDAECDAIESAHATLRAARAKATEMRAGLVINPSIRAAILLILGHLFTNREDSTPGSTPAMAIPMGAHSLLWPYRTGLGV